MAKYKCYVGIMQSSDYTPKDGCVMMVFYKDDKSFHEVYRPMFVEAGTLKELRENIGKEIDSVLSLQFPEYAKINRIAPSGEPWKAPEPMATKEVNMDCLSIGPDTDSQAIIAPKSANLLDLESIL